MRKTSLKQTLSDCDLANDCEALDKHIALFEANSMTKQTKDIQAHYAIPVIYYTRLYNCKARVSSRYRRLTDSKANEVPNNFSVNLS